jgi:hypothetical protein
MHLYVVPLPHLLKAACTGYLPPTLEMESTHINSESDGSWDPDDMCLVDLQFEGDDSVPDDCFGCLDELKIADSVHSGDTQELLRNLPRKASVSASASVPQSISFPLQHQHNLRSSHVNKKASSHANPSHLPAPPKHPTATTPLNVDISHTLSSHVNRSLHSTKPLVQPKPTKGKKKASKKPRLVIAKTNKKGKKKKGQKPGSRTLKHPKQPVVSAFGISGMIGNDDAFIAPATFIAFDNMLREAKSWSQQILFNEANVGDIGSTEINTERIIDICSKINNPCDEPYMFPIRFMGKESKDKLIVELKIASIQSGGFNLHKRSSKPSNDLENSIYDEYISLSCQSSRAYREKKHSKQKYCSSTRYVHYLSKFKPSTLQHFIIHSLTHSLTSTVYSLYIFLNTNFSIVG